MGAVVAFRHCCIAILFVARGKRRLVADCFANRGDCADFRGKGNGTWAAALRGVCSFLWDCFLVATVLRGDDNLSWNVRPDGNFRNDFLD